jgi:hypothetical protein
MIVILPGITGSVLSAPDARGNLRPIWALSGGALWSYLKSMGESLDALAVPKHDPAGEVPETPYVATALMPGFHGVFGLAQVDGYTSLVDTLTGTFSVTRGADDAPANLVEFPYDWRLSCRHNAQLLKVAVGRELARWREYVGEPHARVIVVAHSMGGLVARYWLEVLDGWRVCKILATFGTPYRGSVDAVGYLANGYKKAFVNLAGVLRSCPSVYELLPVYRCLHQDGVWRRAAELMLPHADADYVAAAAKFHREINDAVADHQKNAEYLRGGYRIFPFVGVRQSTLQSAVLDSTGLSTSYDLPGGIDRGLDGGDGRVPRASATPLELSDDYVETFLAEQHGSLQNNLHALDDLIERITQSQLRGLREIQGVWEPRGPAIDVRVDDLYLSGEPVLVHAAPVAWEGPLVFRLTLEPGTAVEPGASVAFTTIETGDGLVAKADGLAPGRYRLTVGSRRVGKDQPIPVTALFEVAG